MPKDDVLYLKRWSFATPKTFFYKIKAYFGVLKEHFSSFKSTALRI